MGLVQWVKSDGSSPVDAVHWTPSTGLGPVYPYILREVYANLSLLGYAWISLYSSNWSIYLKIGS